MNTGKLKPGWRVLKFEDMAENIAKRISPANAETDIYVGLEHLDTESLKLRRWGHPSDVSGEKLEFKKGDVIFGRRRAYQRKLAVAEFNGICSAHAMVLRAKPKVVHPDFLPFFLQSDMFMERAIEISVGSLSPTINWKTLRIQEFPLPPLEEQRRIAEILWAADETVEKFFNVKQYLVASMIVIFKNLINSEGFEAKKISDLGTIVTGSTPSTKNNSYYNPQEYMFVSPADISEEKYVYKTEKMVSIDGFKDGRPIPKDALMVVCIGSTIGKIAMASDECITNQQINSIICNKENNPNFVYHLLRSIDKLFRNVSSCTALPILNKTQFSNLTVEVPEKDVQLRIECKLKYFEDAKVLVQKILLKLKFICDKLREEFISHV